VGTAGGALGHAGGVQYIIPQVQVGPTADQVAVVELDIGCQNLSAGGENGALGPTLTLELTTEHVPGVSTYIRHI